MKGVTRPGWMALVLELNGLSSPDVLREGQLLQLPVTSGGSGASTTPASLNSANSSSNTPTSPSSNSGPSATSQNVSLTTRPASTTSYVVKAGDTVEGIAIAHKVADTQLRSWIEGVRKVNRLNDDAFITEGQKLDLPPLSVAPPAPDAANTSINSTTSGNPPPPPAANSTTTTGTNTTTPNTTQSSSNTTTTGSSVLQNAPRSMTGCFYVIKAEDDLPGIAKKVGVPAAQTDSWIAQLKQMNGVDFKVMPVGTAIQMPC